MSVLGSALSKILFASELIRHGARTPGEFYNFTENESDIYKSPFALTVKGRRQQYLIGRELRHRYIEKEQLISPTYKSDEIYLRSSSVSRTLNSLYSQLFGLYIPSEGNCNIELTEYQQRRAIPPFKIEGLESRVLELGAPALPE